MFIHESQLNRCPLKVSPFLSSTSCAIQAGLPQARASSGGCYAAGACGRCHAGQLCGCVMQRRGPSERPRASHHRMALCSREQRERQHRGARSIALPCASAKSTLQAAQASLCGWAAADGAGGSAAAVGRPSWAACVTKAGTQVTGNVGGRAIGRHLAGRGGTKQGSESTQRGPFD